MTVTIVPPDPPGIRAAGNTALYWLPGETLNLSAVAIRAGVNLTNLVYGFAPEAAQTSTRIEPWLNPAFDRPAPLEYTLGDLAYDYDPQQPASSLYAYAALTPGVHGWILDRRGLPSTIRLEPGHWVDAYPVTLGSRVRMPVEQTQQGERLRVRQALLTRGRPLQDLVTT